MMNFLKDLPLAAKVITAIITLTTAVVSVAWKIDSRYVHEAELQAYEHSHEVEEASRRDDWMKAKIEDLETKKMIQNGKLSQFDQLMLIKYQNELQYSQSKKDD